MRRRITLAVNVCVGAAVVGAFWVLGGAMEAGADTPSTALQPAYYLALGGSGSVGVQPTVADPRGQATDSGYANDVVVAARAVWPELQLVHLGCPGETTKTFVDGVDRCRHGVGSQLSEALAFLAAHRSTVLITIDLGFNDVRPCLAYQEVDQACVSRTLADVRVQLAEILHALQRSAGPAVRIVGIDHYDPFLGDWIRSRQFAADSTQAVGELNATLHAVYGAAGIPVADVAAAFRTGARTLTREPSLGVVPEDVARVCALTWQCASPPYGPNQHPNDKGYAAISRAVMDAISKR